MRILYFLLFSFLMIPPLFGQGFRIDQVNITCQKTKMCSEYKNSFNSLKRSYQSTEHFTDVVKLYVANEGVRKFHYELVNKNDLNVLEVGFLPKLKINHILPIKIQGSHNIELPSILSIKEGDFYDSRKISQAKRILKDVARDKGFPDAKVEEVNERNETGINLGFQVSLKEPIIVEEFNVNSSSSYLEKMASTKLFENVGMPYDLPQIKIDTEELKYLFQDLGYYLVDINLKFRFVSKNKVKLFLDIINPKQIAFNITDSSVFSKSEIKQDLSNAIISGKREFSKENIELILRKNFEAFGYRFSQFKITKEKFKTVNQDELIKYNIKVIEGKRSKLSRISFKGNTFFDNITLRKLFYENSFEQASVDVYDPNYYQNFINLLREHYVSNGFVSVFVDKPFVQFDSKSKIATVSFRIREGLRSFVSEVNISGLNAKATKKILKILEINIDSPFNPIKLKEKLDLSLTYLKNEGFYYSKLLKSKEMVKYEADNTEVKLNLSFIEGPKLYAGDIIIIGNYKTRKRLISRELDFKKGSLITSDAIGRSQSNLMSLGIFKSVQIKPVSKTLGKTDILIFLREKDFGSGEVAPGVRTDLGFKLSTNISYNNIDGLNKRIIFQGTVNRRFDLNSLDDERRKSSKVLLEYDTSVRFSEKKILRSNYDFTLGISKARKRFYSFDADIQRVSYTISQDFTSWLSASVRQQVEQISQFEATDADNSGNFQVGSITPALTLDFRNRPVNPSSGAIFDLSYEVANPTFLSQDVEGESIDYYKLISRNRFYTPIGDHWVLALSAAFGVQENNLGEDGYIPSIKVFRLSGADIVRGFEDEEINRLVSGEDISDNNINSRAYMANIKFEPRFYLSDSTVLGVFYDAGRVFVDEFETDKLRSSAGVSFKYVTPVGTLDFDYGIKLLRKRDSSGNLESPGRLHVSIGFF